MKPVVIRCIIGLSGFIGGFASGYFVHKKINDVKFEEISNEEMEKIESSTQVQYSNDISNNTTNSVISDELGAAQKLPDDPDDIRNALQGKTPFIEADAEQKKAYEKLWNATKQYSDEDNANNIPTYPIEDTEEENEAEGEEKEFDEDFLKAVVDEANSFVDPPHQIDLADFYNEHQEYDKVTIHYYEPDNVWIDEHEDIIADISSYTGIAGKNPFDEEPIDDDPDTRFWTNPVYGSDYEFIRHHRSWAETTG